MTWLNQLLGSQSPKLTRPIRTLVGLVMQRTHRFEHVEIRRDGYVLPFFSSSNVALSYWAVPDLVEPTEDFVRSVLRPGDVFVDVGANVGAVSALAAGLVGPTGRVVAIEPHPTTFTSLQRTITANGFEIVACMEVACGASTGGLNLTDLGRKDDNNHVDDTGAGLAVRAATLAELFRECSLERVDLLKVDVEGFEGSVLRGLAGELSRIGMLYVEVIEGMLQRYGDSTGSVVSLLQEHGFACFGFVDDPNNLVAFSTAVQVAGFGGRLSEMPGNPVLE